MKTFLSVWPCPPHAATYPSGGMQGALWTERGTDWKRERTQGTHSQHQCLWLKFLFNVETCHWDPLLHRRLSNSGPLLNWVANPGTGTEWKIRVPPSFWLQLVVYRITEVRGPVTSQLLWQIITGTSYWTENVVRLRWKSEWVKPNGTFSPWFYCTWGPEGLEAACPTGGTSWAPSCPIFLCQNLIQLLVKRVQGTSPVGAEDSFQEGTDASWLLGINPNWILHNLHDGEKKNSKLGPSSFFMVVPHFIKNVLFWQWLSS